MKSLTYLLFIFFSIQVHAEILTPVKSNLSGKIYDKNSGEPLPGVSIYLPDLKTGAASGYDGTYLIENLPLTKVLVQVTLVGYKSITVTLDLTVIRVQNFSLEESVIEINEVVVTGLSKAEEKNRTATPITTIQPLELQQMVSSNIIDAIASQPGVSQITTGSGISKPVIRGLGYNRVVVVNDGIRQEGQQWGDEHGIEIDEFSVNKVEILKGPASLAYGSDAMAGVINMLSTPTLPQGEIHGNMLANYQTNNALVGYSANVAGNKKGFIWDLRYSNKMAHAYRNKFDGYVFNSGYKENTFGGIIGLNKSWGYSHLHFSRYDLMPGIVEGVRDSSTGKFMKPIALNDSIQSEDFASSADYMSYSSVVPYQKIHHDKIVLNNSFIINHGTLKSTIGFQQNHRQEFADILRPDDYGLYFLLNTINYDARYLFPEKNNYSVSCGINGMQQSSQNKGIEFLVPEYNLFDIGTFLIAKKAINHLDMSGGIRYDNRKIHSDELLLNPLGVVTTEDDTTHIHKFKKFSSQFSSASGSIGFAYQFSEHVFTKVNLSSGFRAPNIAELAANGEHEGTGRYEIGVSHLKPENSFQIDYAFGINTDHISGEADLFYNHVSHFIYTSKLNSVFGGDSLVDVSNPIPTFQYSQGDAVISGGEIMIDFHPHPLDWLHFENSFSYVQSVQKNASDSTKYLPLTPATKFSSDLKANFKKAGKLLNNLYLKLGVDYFFLQNKIYSAYGTETETPAYLLLNTGIGADLISKSKKVLFTWHVSVNNLFDAVYQNHLSRLKYAPENFSSGRNGVYNMGRNISFKLIAPISFNKKK